MRGRVGLEKREGRGKKTFPPFSPVPRGRASHTSRLPRVVRWLGEKKGTALQSKKRRIPLETFITFNFHFSSVDVKLSTLQIYKM